MKISRCCGKLNLNITIDIRGFIFNRWVLLILFLTFAYYVVQYPIISNSVYYSLATASLVYTAIIAAYDFQVRRNERKLDYAIDFMNQFDSVELRRLRDFTRVLRKHMPNISEKELMDYLNPNNKKAIKELLEKYGYLCDKNEDINMERELVFLFNYWQQVYLGIAWGFADSKFLCHTLKPVFDSQYDRFIPWIEENIKPHDSNQYEDLQKFRKMSI